MLVRGQNHCCCKPPKQCEQEVQFNPYIFDETEKPGTTVGFSASYDSGTSSVTLIGEGSLTTRVTSNPKTIFVNAHILDLNAGSGGITIRRIDSNDSVSLWYLGGTSYELRQGTTVLESITHTAASQDLKLELATPRDATTDVLVYIDATLVHTEVGVAFVMPDVLHLGMVTEGASGGDVRFGYLAVSPCPACTPLTVECHGGKPMPVAWRMEVTGVAGEEDTIPINKLLVCEDPEAPQNIEYCDLFNGDYFLVPRSHALRNTPLGFCNIPTGNAWGEPPEGWPDCEYISAFPMPNVPGYSTPVPEGFVSGLIKYYCMISGSTVDNICFYPADRSMGMIPGLSGPVDATPAVTLDVFHSIPNSTMTFNVALSYSYREDFDPGEGLQAIYESNEISDTTDFLTTGITLNKVSSSGCTDMPNTLFLDPDSEEARGLVQQLSKCGQTCTPPVTPQPGTCYVQSINLVDADDNPWYMTAVLGVQFDEVTGSWDWEGTATPHPLADPHPTCGYIISATVKIHCVELEEGAAKSWVLDLTYDDQTSRFPMVEDPEFGYGWEGTTDIICSGQMWDFFAGPLNSSESTWQFGSCEWDACADPHGYYFGAGLITECDGGSGYTQNGGLLIFSPTSPRPWMTSPSGSAYYSPVPSGYSGQVAGIYIYVESGTVRVQLVDGQLDPIPDGFASVAYSCDPNGRPVIDDTSPISYLWGFPSPVTSDPFGVCEGTTGFGSWEVVFP